jgi:ABC-type sugar transport system substrate-binding protein
MTRPDPDPWDADLSKALTGVEGLGVRLAIWQARAEPDAPARRAASAAIGAIDTATAALYRIREGLITETRQADDQAAARADELLAEAREGPPGTGPPDVDGGPRQVIPAGGRPSAEPPPSAIDVHTVTRGGDRPGAS